ncbi:MAG TPA: hypothetical protein VLQ76_01335 [Bacteroidales bacterium]|nr:hypothetical protein [Bacteroidales bacterium]
MQNITMAIPSFFKQTKPRGFNYAPRHYDPVKEEREARHSAMGLDAGSREQGARGMEQGVGSREQGASGREHGEGSMVKENESAGQRPFRRTITKGSLRDLYHRSRGRTHQQNSIRLIIIILILVLATYLYLRF